MGECNNEEGSYSCTCKPGAEPDADLVTCEDIEDCMNNPCVQGTCSENPPFPYKCECFSGYRETEKSGEYGTICVDIDECAEGSDFCDGGDCSNSAAFPYECTCLQGYSPGTKEVGDVFYPSCIPGTSTPDPSDSCPDCGQSNSGASCQYSESEGYYCQCFDPEKEFRDTPKRCFKKDDK
ncbi:uncharacterized protein LOC142341182 [Convolutriloba macropyga]|uniref:uncharacterized protein LOC142341182 n=1 Tax=Convolutriloba macropyga TaxID=536237 RepID=UPI003F520CC2